MPSPFSTFQQTVGPWELRSTYPVLLCIAQYVCYQHW